MNTITGTVEKVIRHGHTVYGNPMMSVILALKGNDSIDGHLTVRISDNASLVYAIENAEFRGSLTRSFSLGRDVSATWPRAKCVAPWVARMTDSARVRFFPRRTVETPRRRRTVCRIGA